MAYPDTCPECGEDHAWCDPTDPCQTEEEMVTDAPVGLSGTLGILPGGYFAGLLAKGDAR